MCKADNNIVAQDLIANDNLVATCKFEGKRLEKQGDTYGDLPGRLDSCSFVAYKLLRFLMEEFILEIKLIYIFT